MRILLFLSISFITTEAQISCTQHNISGTWKTLKRNVDMDIIDRIKNGIEVLTPMSGSLTFEMNGKCISVSELRKRPYIRKYRFYEKECMIVWGKYRKPERENMCKILYLDEKYMIMKFPNPKTEVPCLLIKE